MLIVLLFAGGATAWPFLFDGFNPAARNACLSFGVFGPVGLLLLCIVVAAISWIPPLVAPLQRFLVRLRAASDRRRSVCSLLAAFISTGFLYLAAGAQHRQFVPLVQDEFSYLIQARQLAGGHLWMPAHPLGAFFDSFQLLVEPVYASAYFPGTALLHVPGIWLHLPPWVTSLAIAGAVVGLLFWSTAELLDGLWAWVAVLLVLGDSMYRQLSIMTMAQLPLLLDVLLATVLWLRWRRSGRIASAVWIGVCLGMAAITRPVDALTFAVPIGAAIAFSTVPRATRARAVLAILAGMIPFLVLQLVLDRGITGKWLHTPFDLYAERDYPGTTYGFHTFDPNARPVSQLPQKQWVYERYELMRREHRPANILRELWHFRLRVAFTQQSPVPYPLLFLLCPLALAGLNRLRMVMLATFPVYLLLSAPYVFFMPHYVTTVMPAIILAMLTGAKAVVKLASQASQPARARVLGRFAMVGLVLFIAGEAIAAFPPWTNAQDYWHPADLMVDANQQLASLPHRPAVVLFTFDPYRHLDEEPVYNADVAWPDDAEVIRAHDLGAKNAEIFRYYAEHQPNRFFYRFDEATGKVQPLGLASELGK
jgi:hypothetical protein